MIASQSHPSSSPQGGVVIPAQEVFDRARRAAQGAGLGKPPQSRAAKMRAALAQCEGDADLFELVVVPDLVLARRRASSGR